MATVFNDDARRIADLIEPESVQTCITSPPYFGLRDYGVDGQIGLEGDIEAYVLSLLEVFRGVWKVLRPDGTLWLNLGDSYNGSGTTGSLTSIQGTNVGSHKKTVTRVATLKPKDLIGIPWRVAFALQADGWYLRSDIIWHKPNPMPESVTDRPTKAHEYLFLLSKSPHYYYDAEAIAEPAVTVDGRKTTFKRDKGKMLGLSSPVNRVSSHRPDRKDTPPRATRNRRSVWTIATRPYPEAHFATFPEKLVEPCILAGSRPGDVVLDPFAGSGTTLAVAERLQREAIGIELNSDYIRLIHQRLQRNQVQMVF